MLYKHNWPKIHVIPILQLVIFGFLLTIYFAACNNDRKTEATTAVKNTDSTQTNREEPFDENFEPGPNDIDWLQEWPAITFNASADDSDAIALSKKRVRAYARGWLLEWNDSAHDNYKVRRFRFDEQSTRPLTFKVHAWLMPPAQSSESEPGGHLIPKEPPPPGGTQ